MPPRILALETSSRLGSLALADGPHILLEHSFSHGFRHAAELLPALDSLLRQLAWKPADLQHIYLSTGPGSFTGLRIAVTLARTLAQTLGCQLVAVPTLDVLASNAPPEIPNLVVLLDAKRNQIFAARYQRQPDGTLLRTAGPLLTDPTTFLKQSPTPLAILGEGIPYHRPALLAALPPELLTLLPEDSWPPSAQNVHRLGYALAQHHRFTDPATLLPAYIRLPEAEELYRLRHNQPIG